MTGAKPGLLSLNTYHYRRGGADVAFLENDRLFASHGWRTAVFAMHHPKNEPSPWAEFFADELEFGSNYGLWQKMVMAGKVVYSFEAKRKLERLVDHFRPDVAHAHCVYHHLSPSTLALLRQRGIPTVMTAHDLKLACPAYKMFNSSGVCERCKGGNTMNVAIHRCLHGSLALSSLIMVESTVHKALDLYKRNLDRVIVPSKFYGDKLEEWGWPKEKLVYIPNFIDAERYSPSYEPGDYFLFFGRLASEKGVETLIRAALKVGVRLKIAGTGPVEAALKKLAEGREEIEFLGYRSGDALWQLVRDARAVVLPSEWYENAPLSVLEAYASGKVVIGSRIGGITELVGEDTGFRFEAGSADSLAAALESVAAMPAERLAAMGRAARDYVGKEFTRELYLARTLALYKSLGVAA